MLCARGRGALQQMLRLVDEGQTQFSTSQQEEILHHPQLSRQVSLLNHHHPQVLQTHTHTDLMNIHADSDILKHSEHTHTHTDFLEWNEMVWTF